MRAKSMVGVAGSVLLVLVSVVGSGTEGEAFAKPGRKPKVAQVKKKPAPPPAPAGTAAQPVPAGENWKKSAGSKACNSNFTDYTKEGLPNRECRASDTCCEKFANGGVYSSCTTLDSDPNNCGGCGQKCLFDKGETCREGLCACRTGESRCNGTCIDTLEDASNCGACGNACSQICSKGACTTCARFNPGTTFCGDGGCANLMTDDGNCGKCGHSCPGGWTCSRGRCLP